MVNTHTYPQLGPSHNTIGLSRTAKLYTIQAKLSLCLLSWQWPNSHCKTAIKYSIRNLMNQTSAQHQQRSVGFRVSIRSSIFFIAENHYGLFTTWQSTLLFIYTCVVGTWNAAVVAGCLFCWVIFSCVLNFRLISHTVSQ